MRRKPSATGEQLIRWPGTIAGRPTGGMAADHPARRAHRALLACALLACALLVACEKERLPVDVSSKAEAQKIIESEKAIQSLNSVSFCVVKDNEVVWADAIGYADRERKRPATPATRYLVASISKTVTAVAAMQLYEKGLLALDEDVNKYLPFKVENPAFPGQKITTRMLLSHSSSISDDRYQELNLYCFGFDCPQSLGDFMKDFFTEGRQFYSKRNYYDYPPGSRGNYTNVGFALLGYIVERVSGQDFKAYCKENIFLPLGMRESEFSLKDTPRDELAIPYSPLVTGVFQSPHYTVLDVPAGGLRTTVNDLSRFQRALIANGTFNNYQLLKPGTVQLMKQGAYTFVRGNLTVTQGLGLYYRKVGDMTLLGHGGGDMGITSEMLYDPATNVGVIVFTNTTSIVTLDLIVNSLIQFGKTQ